MSSLLSIVCISSNFECRMFIGVALRRHYRPWPAFRIYIFKSFKLAYITVTHGVYICMLLGYAPTCILETKANIEGACTRTHSWTCTASLIMPMHFIAGNNVLGMYCCCCRYTFATADKWKIKFCSVHMFGF